MGGPLIPLDQAHIEGIADNAFGSAYVNASAHAKELDSLFGLLRRVPLTTPVRGSEYEQTSDFGARVDPFTRHVAFHPGIDWAGPWGSAVKATAPGTVVFAGPRGGYGNMVEIDHGFGIKTRYGHLSSILVRVGAKVAKGSPVGKLGSTGRSTGPHVHYEIWLADVVRDPRGSSRLDVMFSSKSKDTPPQAMPMAPAAKPVRSGRSSAPSIISADLVVHGNLVSTGDIQIDGRVEGDVQSSGLVIGDKAFIQGEIMAEDVTVRGRIQGSIRARKVLLASTCHVEGNILHEAFAVETGAFFEGNCRHSDNPLAEEARPAAIRPAVAAPRCRRARPGGSDGTQAGRSPAPGRDLRAAEIRRLTPFRFAECDPAPASRCGVCLYGGTGTVLASSPFAFRGDQACRPPSLPKTSPSSRMSSSKSPQRTASPGLRPSRAHWPPQAWRCC